MGLDTSHDSWHGAYSAFHRWRERIAEASGHEKAFQTGQMLIDAAEDVIDIALGTWKKVPKDPILILLCHSDCDGFIAAEHTKILADRLEELLPNLYGDGGGHIGGFREKTEQFIKGLRSAAEAKESVEFA